MDDEISGDSMQRGEFAELVRQSNLDDVDLVLRAVEFNSTAMRGITRLSGEPFEDHCHAVAALLLTEGQTAEVVAAGVLHDVNEDTDVTIDEIARQFGGLIAFLVDGMSTWDIQPNGLDWREKKLLFWSRFLCFAEYDPRLFSIKLADRLHNVRTWEPLPCMNRRRIAWETIDVLLPLAESIRLSPVGLSWMENLKTGVESEYRHDGNPFLFASGQVSLMEEMLSRRSHHEVVDPFGALMRSEMHGTT
ncbi:MAG: HD domain-containing protein [bacterium]|nr:HD domain-containing protein [bacterium]